MSLPTGILRHAWAHVQVEQNVQQLQSELQLAQRLMPGIQRSLQQE